jgi:hypothetical protein
MSNCKSDACGAARVHREKIKPKALFILKRRQDYSTDLANFTNYTVATGMYNSSKFVVDMLNENGVDAKIAVVIDNNCIDREVTQYKPTHVFIEGIWVVPEKFIVLKRLHPNVEWVIRCHSEIPFLSHEGNAINWVLEYLKNGVKVSCNSPRVNRELRLIALAKLGAKFDIESKMPLLPNYYPVPEEFGGRPYVKGVINIGCFGAIRPMKNHLMQALAAIEFAEKNRYHLRFHINAGRIESNGNNGLKNLKSLFSHLPQYELIEHSWTTHELFLKTVNVMDICLQVSFSETFNIVTADAVVQGVPVIVSDEISWVCPPYANPNDSSSIVDAMSDVWVNRRYYTKRNLERLRNFSQKSSQLWIEYINKKGVEYNIGLGHILFSGLKRILGLSCILLPLISS